MSGLYDQISYLIHRAGRALLARRSADLSGVGLHCGQDLVLAEVAKKEGLRPSELADRLGVEPPTITKTLQRLEAAGLLVRSGDPADARATCVRLTDTGRKLDEHVDRCWQSVETQALKGLTQDERVLLQRLLLRVITNLEQPVEMTVRQNGM